MTNDQATEHHLFFPKKERGNFFILLAFLLLLTANLSSLFYDNAIPYEQVKDLMTFSVDELRSICFFINITVIIATFIFCGIGITRKNYSMLATLGCILIIAANLGFFSRNPIFIGQAKLFLVCALFLLIPAINERLSQISSLQTAHKRIGFAYVFAFIFFVALMTLIGFLRSMLTPAQLILFNNLIYANLAVLTLSLWVLSKRKKTWVNTAKVQPSYNRSKREYGAVVLRILSYIIILIILWMSMMAGGGLIFIALFIIAGFFSYFWNKESRALFIFHRVAFIYVSISFIALIAIAREFLPLGIAPTGIIHLLVLLNAVFIPFCLTNCRRALIYAPFPQNKGWIHLCLLLAFPLSFIGFVLLLDVILSALGLR